MLANMAQSSSSFSEIVENDGLRLLLDFLHINPATGSLTEAELAACERVHQKAAIALTRLAKEPNNAQTIVEKGGRQCNSRQPTLYMVYIVKSISLKIHWKKSSQSGQIAVF